MRKPPLLQPYSLGRIVSLVDRRAYRMRTGQQVLLKTLRWSSVAAILLAGCSTIPQYPATLPALVEADTTVEACPPIAGTFSDAGTATSPDGRILGTASLTRLLHSRSKEFDQADVVVVRGPEGDVVEIASFAGQRRVATWQQSKLSNEAYLTKGDRALTENYGCQNGFLRLCRAYNVGAGAFMLGVKSDFLWLRKATDGSLIALHSDYDYIVFLVLPVGSIDKVWYRFPPATPTIPKAPDASPQGTREEASRP